MTYSTFERRRAAALVQLARAQADLQMLVDLLGRVKDVRSGNDWHAWSRNIESAHDTLGAAVADVTRNAVV